MRTLKKSLALVLALVMVFSLAVTASADFTDADEIAYTDEVELLVALDIIEGYEDGSFQPTKTLTRAEAAVIAARLNAYFEKTSATTSYTDMAGYGWAEWAVAYCENEGIVNGVGAGKFEPATTLTGYMWVKMVLVSMGYDAVENGMTGAAWQVGVAKLYKDVLDFAAGLDLSAEITREEACAVAYAALLATRDGNEFAVSHYTTEKGDHFHFFATEAEAIAFATAIGGEVISGEFVTSLGFEKHGLMEYTIGFGQWGEPFFGWKTVNGFITKTWIDPSVEIYETVTEDELFALAMEAGLYFEEFADTEDYLEILNLFIDGNYVKSYDIWKGYKGVVPFSGNGTRLALYDAGMYGIIGVSVNQYLGVVVADVPGVATTGADPFVVIANICDGSHFDLEEAETYTLYNYDADLGDVVLYNVCAGEITKIHTPNTVSGTVEQIDLRNTDKEYDDVYTISGTEYVLSQHEAIEDIIGGETSIWFVDDCGNLIMKAADIPFNYEIGFLLSYDAENYYKGDEMHTCEEYFASEKFEIYNIKTGETTVFDGNVKVAGNTTTFTMGNSVTNETPWTGDALDLVNVSYDVENAAGLSLGLVVYLTDANGNIFYISDEKAGNNSLYIFNSEEELSVSPFDVNLWDGAAYAGLMLDGTEYVYATLENCAINAVATGIKNADELTAVGEYMIDETGLVVAVAQYEPTPVVEPEGPTATVENVFVYVSGEYKVVKQEFYKVDALGNKVGPFVQYLVDGLYIDGAAIETQVFTADPEFLVGNLYEVEITTWSTGDVEWAIVDGPWALDPAGLAVEYIGTGAAGDYMLLEDGSQWHMAAGANIVCIYDADYTVAGTYESITEIDYSFGKMVVMFVAYDASGLVTDLYFYVDGLL